MAGTSAAIWSPNPPVATTLAVLAQFLSDLGDDGLGQADVSEIKPRLHAGHGRFADDAGRLADFDPGQLGRFEIEGLGRNQDARGDRPAQVLALGRNRVERRGRAEIDDDARSAVFFVGGDGGRDPVRPDFGRSVVEDGHARAQARADDERPDAEQSTGRGSEKSA